MPAERADKGKRDGETAFHLNSWSQQVEPNEPQKFSFAPNVTPVTFTAPQPADEDNVPSQSTLFPDPVPSAFSFASSSPDSPTYQPAPKRRRKAASSKDSDTGDDGSVTPEHIPRPPNAFILFRSSFIKSQHVSSSIEGNHGTLSKIVGMVWHNLSFEERQIWQAKAKRALAEHKRRFPDYSFRPSNKDKDRVRAAAGEFVKSVNARDASVPPQKRKQRECGPRDEARCEHIASLVAKGLKGQDLEDAMKHFDATRAPTVITPRFEQPITAQQFETGQTKVKAEPKEVKVDSQQQQQQKLPVQRFRRGSSAPLLDSEHTQTSRKQSTFLQRPVSPLQPSPIRPYVDSIPSIRSQRKRSASSSPPIRPRILLPAVSLPSISTQPPTLTLSTSMSEAQMQSYSATAPLSAPALSRQSTLVMDQSPQGDYYNYDDSSAVYYDNAAGSSPNTAISSDYDYSNSHSWESQSSLDFSTFSFNAPSATPAPVVTPQTESYSPFDNVQVASVPTDYSDMPNLVDPPNYRHPLHVQTSWAQSEFDYQQHEYYPPPSATTIDSNGSAISPVKPYAHAQPGVAMQYDMYASPTSPSNTSVSDCAVTQAHTPREGSAEPSSAVFAQSAPEVYGGHQDTSSCYSTQIAYDHCMNVNVSVNMGDVDPSMFQAYLSQQAKLGGFQFNHDPYMQGMTQPQAQQTV